MRFSLSWGSRDGVSASVASDICDIYNANPLRSFPGQFGIKQIHVRNFFRNLSQWRVVAIGQNDHREFLFREPLQPRRKSHRASIMPDFSQTAVFAEEPAEAVAQIIFMQS